MVSWTVSRQRKAPTFPKPKSTEPQLQWETTKQMHCKTWSQHAKLVSRQVCTSIISVYAQIAQ